MYDRLIGEDGLTQPPLNSPFTEMVNLTIRSGNRPCRRFFVTTTSFMGLGTPECNEGDVICMLYGYSMPVLLRSELGYNTFVGSAYVHGIMHGSNARRGHRRTCRSSIFDEDLVIVTVILL